MDIAAMTLDQARAEYWRIDGFRGHSTSDLRRMNHCLHRIEALEAAAAGLEAELAEAKAVYAQVLEDLTPYNEAIEYGDGWFGRARQVRHAQLTRKLDAAQQRVWAAEDAIARQTAAAVA